MEKKRKNKVPKMFRESEVGTLIEHFESKVDLIAEGMQSMDAKVDRVDAKVDKLDGKVDDLQKEMDYKFELVFDELHLIRNELKEKVGRDEFVLLEKRVAALEKAGRK